jgi:hypothetical protein
VGLVGAPQRLGGVLLDQEHGGPLLVDLADDREDLLISRGASPIEGSSSSTSRGRAISALPIASICCSPPDIVPAVWFTRSSRRGKSWKTRSTSSRYAGVLRSVRT